MGLENASYIGELVDTNPDGTDTKNQGDNHIRMIKEVLQNQFPNLGNEAMTATASQLNDLIDNNRGTPSGAILMWHGTTGTIPTGWVLCNGYNNTPNLTNRFILASTTANTTGGSNTSTGTVGGTALTEAQIPPHTHDIQTRDLETLTGSVGEQGGGTARTRTTESTGGGKEHDHSFTGGDNRPAYYSLIFIMKT